MRDHALGVAEVAVSRDDTSCAALVDVETRRSEALAPYERRFGDLEDLQERERAEYARRLQAAVVEYANRRYPHLEVVVDVDLDRYADHGAPEDPMVQTVLQHAIEHTPLPGSGFTPHDYPPGPIGDHERAAGRLPHTRLPGVTGEPAEQA